MSEQLSRKDFLLVTVGLATGGALLVACRSDNAAASPAAASPCGKNGAKDSGLNDPTHHLVVPAPDVVAGVSHTYSIKGTSTHDHKITLEAADFVSLVAGTKVTVTSTTGLGHVHTFDVVCA
jgi:hypothetical protein